MKVFRLTYSLILNDGTVLVKVVSAPDVGTAIDALNQSLGTTVSVSSAEAIATIDVDATAQDLQAQLTQAQAASPAKV